MEEGYRRLDARQRNTKHFTRELEKEEEMGEIHREEPTKSCHKERKKRQEQFVSEQCLRSANPRNITYCASLAKLQCDLIAGKWIIVGT